MSVANTLMERRAAVVDDLQALVDRVATENRAFSAEEEQSYQRMNAEIDTLASKAQGILDAEKRNANLSTEFAARQGNQKPAVTDGGELRSFLRDGGPGSIEFRDLSLTAAEGGNTVDRQFVTTLYEHLVDTASVLQANPTVLNTEGGNTLDIPKTTDHGAAAAATINTAVPEDDPVFGKVTLAAFKYGQLIDVPTELIEDSGVDIEGYLARALGRNLGLQLGSVFAVGAGTTEPFGAVTQSTLGVTAASGAAITFDTMIDLFYSVSSPYRASQSCYWIMNDATAALIRKLRDNSGGAGTGQYLWQPSVIAGQPDMILGKPVAVDPNFPGAGAAAKRVVFGDYAAFYVRYAGGLRVERSTDAKFASDQVSFRGIVRADSALVDTSALKHLITTAA